MNPAPTDPRLFRVDTRIPIVSIIAGGVFLIVQSVWFTALIVDMNSDIKALKKEQEIDTTNRTVFIQQGVQLQNLSGKIDVFSTKLDKVDEKIDDLTHAKSFDRSRK